ncbi:hypothetical protein L1987_33287 [Smallanthus sonchifolius]|uniref:Uncharacterized protein n=1 Tax=Smallanthus sonchifolius TaxID=185202 RepID=A0ACB9HRA1_9ASTR|nr:hypothetical protein L1987_33287 [Smallanthus sonchifolius]
MALSSSSEWNKSKNELMKQVKEQYEQDILTIKSLKECFILLNIGFLKRDEITNMLPSSYIRNLTVLFTLDVCTKDVELMTAIKDIIKTVESSMELKLAMLLSYA